MLQTDNCVERAASARVHKSKPQAATRLTVEEALRLQGLGFWPWPARCVDDIVRDVARCDFVIVSAQNLQQLRGSGWVKFTPRLWDATSFHGKP